MIKKHECLSAVIIEQETVIMNQDETIHELEQQLAVYKKSEESYAAIIHGLKEENDAACVVVQDAIDRIDSVESKLALQKSIVKLWKSESGWQPISTAPKDGTEIDLFFDKGIGNEGFRIADCAWSGDGWYSENLLDKYGHEKELDYMLPTHWQPLPQPPNESEES